MEGATMKEVLVNEYLVVCVLPDGRERTVETYPRLRTARDVSRERQLQTGTPHHWVSTVRRVRVSSVPVIPRHG